jgi:hemerythrin-like metal-binding protein
MNNLPLGRPSSALQGGEGDFINGEIVMSLITWSDKLSVGVEKIDLQHQVIVDLTNDLHEAMTVGKGYTVLAKVLDESLRYGVYHFETEDRLMKTHGLYGDYLQHDLQHKRFIEYLTTLKVELKSEPYNQNFNITVLNFLSAWFNQHILKSDKKLGIFLNTKGIA